MDKEYLVKQVPRKHRPEAYGVHYGHQIIITMPSEALAEATAAALTEAHSRGADEEKTWGDQF